MVPNFSGRPGALRDAMKQLAHAEFVHHAFDMIEVPAETPPVESTTSKRVASARRVANLLDSVARDF